MKIAVTILLLAIAVICASAQHNTTWGDVVNTRILAEERVDVKPTWMRVKERTVSYRSNGPIIVRGLMHMDYYNVSQSRPSASISNGGIGMPFAALRIVSRRGHGINSVVRFYG